MLVSAGGGEGGYSRVVFCDSCDFVEVFFSSNELTSPITY